MRRQVSRSGPEKLRLLAIPPPFQSWLTLSNDPDHTTVENWIQLDQVIWKDLKLPFADSFFVENYNDCFPFQVNLRDHPEILQAHAHDTMHTWGDFLHSKQVKFHRDHAVEALALLQKLGTVPRIWTDHSGFEGNLLHRATRKATAQFQDSAGHLYTNESFTLDLIAAAGVKYIWDGHTTRVIAQDRVVSRTEHYSGAANSTARGILKALADILGQPLWRAVRAQLFDYKAGDNQQLQVHVFPQQQRFYQFRRYGAWRDADIDGLQTSLSQQFIDSLLSNQGTCIVYTHLGKRKACRTEDSEHIPADTVSALSRIGDLHRSGDLLLSGTADLLDYLVLRDHAVVDSGIDFRPDGIRFSTLAASDLRHFRFGVYSKKGDFEVLCNGKTVDHRIDDYGNGDFLISFTGSYPKPQSPSG